MQNQRKLQGMVTHPNIQLKFVFIFFILSSALLVLTAYFLYINFFRFFELLIELHPIKEDLQMLLEEKVSETFVSLCIGLGVYFFGIGFLMLYLSHKVVGPTIAFKRHIANLITGNTSSRVKLRKFDAFQELADDLNTLAKKMEQ